MGLNIIFKTLKGEPLYLEISLCAFEIRNLFQPVTVRQNIQTVLTVDSSSCTLDVPFSFDLECFDLL